MGGSCLSPNSRFVKEVDSYCTNASNLSHPPFNFTLKWQWKLRLWTFLIWNKNCRSAENVYSKRRAAQISLSKSWQNASSDSFRCLRRLSCPVLSLKQSLPQTAKLQMDPETSLASGKPSSMLIFNVLYLISFSTWPTAAFAFQAHRLDQKHHSFSNCTTFYLLNNMQVIHNSQMIDTNHSKIDRV